MASPKTIKEVQKLIGRIAALNMFISKVTDKCLPFFKTLKQAFTLTDEYEKAEQSKEGENLYLYLALLATVVSATLIQEEDRTQLPVYYVSQAFQEAKAKYPWIEKIAFAFIVSSRKLHPYF